MLVDAGARVDVKDTFDRTPLHHACCSARANCALVLLEAGADAEAVDATGKTPRDIAREEHRADIVNMLDAAIACKLARAQCTLLSIPTNGELDEPTATANGDDVAREEPPDAEQSDSGRASSSTHDEAVSTLSSKQDMALIATLQQQLAEERRARQSAEARAAEAEARAERATQPTSLLGLLCLPCSAHECDAVTAQDIND